MKARIGTVCGIALAAGMAVPSFGQASGVSSVPAVQESRLTFDVASVRLDRSDTPADSNVPLNAGDMYSPTGGLFSATNWPLVSYIFFAYKLQGNQGKSLASQLPGWATTDNYDIQARAAGNPTKDQMRLMMRSLLADRFHLALHTETRELPVFDLVQAKPGRTGPQLQPHSSETPCQTDIPSASSPGASLMIAGGFPVICNTILGLPPSVPGRSRLAGRNVTIAYFADLLSQRVDLGRPIVDATGLSGTFDFILEFKPESHGSASEASATSDPNGLSLEQALLDQLGLKLKSGKSTLQFLVLDRLERPSEN